MKLKSFVTGMMLAAIAMSACKETTPRSTKQESVETQIVVAATKITFVELGSVNCIPCKKMQPIMESINRKYGDQIEVVFHDVWQDKRPAEQYGIRLIPTQVFLDQLGNEIMRHEGFFPEDQIDQFLQAQGLSMLPGM